MDVKVEHSVEKELANLNRNFPVFQAAKRFGDPEDIWLSNLARAESGSLPTYATTAANEILARQAELRGQIRSSTFLSYRPEPEVEDLGPEATCDPMGPPGDHFASRETEALPPPVADDGATGSVGYQEELSQSKRHLRSQGPVVNQVIKN